MDKYSRVEQRDYQKSCIIDTVNALNDSFDVLINLPTGAGKTMVYSPIIAQASEEKLRTIILTATKQAQKHVRYEITKFSSLDKPTLIFGIQEYDCPLLKQKAKNWFCRENKDECKKKKMNCAVIQSEKDYSEKNLVITNFSKFLLTPSDQHFDIIVLDDSHSFENSKEQVHQLTIQAAAARHLYEKGTKNSKILALIEDFLNIYAEVFERCIIPGSKEGVISMEYVSKLAKLASKHDIEDLHNEIDETSLYCDRIVCWNIYHFIKHCTRSSSFQFYVRSDFYEPDDWDSSELISRKDNIGFILKKRFNDSSLIFSTATPGNALKHASSCSNRQYNTQDLKITPKDDSNYSEIENWFKKLSIFVVTNIGDTRFHEPFESAINLTTQLLSNRPERALVLFKNYRDQSKANERLKKSFNDDKLFFIESSTQDSDFVEELASKTQISLASASSTLWEGITIRNLRMAIIVTAPFIRPVVGKQQTYPEMERRMLIRLQQGIGRLIRSPSDYGVAVLMDSRFQKYVKRKNFDKKLSKQIEFLTADQVLAHTTKALNCKRGV